MNVREALTKIGSTLGYTVKRWNLEIANSLEMSQSSVSTRIHYMISECDRVAQE